MKKLILFACCLLCLLSFSSRAQDSIGQPLDSTAFTFSTTDSLTHYLSNFYPISAQIDTSEIDSNNNYLWQIGNTSKPMFSSNGALSKGIMTDTIGAYPANANSSFVLKVDYPDTGSIYYQDNPILIEIWHEYQTDSFHAGGIVEVSGESGNTWTNALDCQNQTANTLFSGAAAYMGRSNGQQLSSFYFLGCALLKSTQLIHCNLPPNYLYLRFRFQSDSTQDTLSGWKIDSIKVLVTGCAPGSVRAISKTTLSINPNPAYDGSFNFPEMDNEQKYTIDIFNELGDKILTMPYRHTINISNYARGLYFYKVTGDNEQYSGKLLYE